MLFNKLSTSTMIAFVHALVLSFVGLNVVSAQTPDEFPPANETVCDELLSGTLGLYGLCVAFCEAQDFNLIDLDDPDTLKHIPSNRILDQYRNKMQPGDTDMPCVQPRCPCWTQQELDGLRFPPAEIEFCQKDASNPAATNIDQWRLVSSSPTFFSTVVVTAELIDNSRGRWCVFSDRCADGNCLGVLRSITNLTEEEFAFCETQVAESGEARGFDCFLE